VITEELGLPVNPRVLRWAREHVSGISLDDAATDLRIAPDELSAIEEGIRPVGITRLRTMATKYHLPLATLLMPTPLPAPKLPRDRRTLPGAAKPLQAETLFAIRRVTGWKESLLELAEDAPQVIEAPALPRASLRDSREKVGAQLRDFVGLTVDEQVAWPRPAYGYARCRWMVEERGVFVFQLRMPVDDCRGFSLMEPDDVAPVIVINSAESAPQAKLFTLFHELGHLVLRSGAICLEQHRIPVEAFCNAVAAAALMPDDALSAAFGLPGGELPEGQHALDEVARAAGRIGVSISALALRLEERGLAPKGYYRQIVGRLRRPTDEARGPERGGGGPGFAVRQLSERGSRYTGVVLRAFRSGAIGQVEADDLLGVSATTLPSVESQLGEQRRLYSTGPRASGS
jgi:Zn-dependent peptidase ImmA (M78 family)/transcriptional regulator with XRE-family HTH domain